jgi:hypothetical protein
MDTRTSLKQLPPLEHRPGLDEHQYVEQEWIVEGTADAFDPAGILIARDVPYATRVLVRRPSDPAGASGTVFLDPLHMINEMPAGTVATG